MSEIQISAAPISDLYIIDNFYAGDNRGCFSKIYEKDIFKKTGIDFSLNETFYSVSAKNVVRGLHFQLHSPQAKLVTVIQGKVWDVAVDLRPNSSTYRKWFSVELSSDNHKSFYIPAGFAHGFASLNDGTIMLYQCKGAYDKVTDTGIRFDDPEIGIKWPIEDSEAMHSSRDMNLMSFSEYDAHPMQL